MSFLPFYQIKLFFQLFLFVCIFLFPYFHFCLHLTFASPPPSLTFQPWRNLEAIPPLRHSGSHLTRSITLCLFQLKLTPFAVKSMVIPGRKVTHPCYTRCPRGFKCFWMYIMLLQEDLYCQMVIQRLDLRSSPCGKMCAWHMCSQLKFYTEMRSS